jgi:hypothetical protein
LQNNIKKLSAKERLERGIMTVYRNGINKPVPIIFDDLFNFEQLFEIQQDIKAILQLAYDETRDIGQYLKEKIFTKKELKQIKAIKKKRNG